MPFRPRRAGKYVIFRKKGAEPGPNLSYGQFHQPKLHSKWLARY